MHQNLDVGPAVLKEWVRFYILLENALGVHPNRELGLTADFGLVHVNAV